MDSGSNGNYRKISCDKDTIDSLKCNKVDNEDGFSEINCREVNDSNTIGSLKSNNDIAKGTGNVHKKIDCVSGISNVVSVNKHIIDTLNNQNMDLTKDTGSVVKEIDAVNCNSDSKDTIDIDGLKNNNDSSNVLDDVGSKKECPKPNGECNVFNVLPSEGGKTKIGNVGNTANQNKPYLKCLKTSGSDCIGKSKEEKMRMNIMKLFLDRKNKKCSPIAKVNDSTVIKKTTDDCNEEKCKIKADGKVKMKIDGKTKNKGRSILKQNVKVEEPKESKKELKLKDDLSEFLVVRKFTEKTTEIGKDSNIEAKIFSRNTNSLLKTSLVSLLTKETTFPTNNLQLYIPIKPKKEKPKITVDEVQKKIKTVSIGSLYENLVRDTVTDDNDNYCNNESITQANLYNPESIDLIDIGQEINTMVEKKGRKRKHCDSDQETVSGNETKNKLKNLATENSPDKKFNNNNTDLKLNKSKKVIKLDDGGKIRFEYVPNPDLKTIDLTESSENTNDIPTDDDSKINPDLPVLVL